ncbi:hypothetical protein VTN96DRAFT_6405 [Rasamsonia emersonii]
MPKQMAMREAHKDSVRAENKYLEDSIQLQNRVLEDYKIWASQDSDMNKKDCLCEGQPAPDLATIKDFIRYYIFSTQGMLSIRQTVSSVLNFAERFFARFTHVTKTTFDKKDAEDVYYVGCYS